MTLRDSIRICLVKYADFTGRASRSEFLWFWISTGALVGLTSEIQIAGISYLTIGLVLWFATLLPSLAAATRRMHDRGKSGWPFAVGIILAFLLLSYASTPFERRPGDVTQFEWLLFLAFWLLSFRLFWLATEHSQPGPNKYGPNPHEVTP